MMSGPEEMTSTDLCSECGGEGIVFLREIRGYEACPKCHGAKQAARKGKT
jgi:DnaJ-class molecular chaperone